MSNEQLEQQLREARETLNATQKAYEEERQDHYLMTNHTLAQEKELAQAQKHAAHWEEEFHVCRELLVKQEQRARELQDELAQARALLVMASRFMVLVNTTDTLLYQDISAFLAQEGGAG